MEYMEAIETIDPVNIIFTATGGRFRKSKGYLSCDNCRGYYELERWESPEDFCEQCECGGRLSFTQLIERDIHPDNHEDSQINHFEDDRTPKQKWDDLDRFDDSNQKQDDFDLIKMEWETEERLDENYEGEVKIPRQLPWGPIFILIFFMVLIITFGIFSILLGFDSVISVMNF